MAVGCLGIEAVLRVRVALDDQPVMEDALAAADAAGVVPDGSDHSLRDLIRYSSNRRIVYELRPGLDGLRFMGTSVSTNAAGFRGPELSPERDARTVRIVGLGDSVMFGWGVEESETYLARLQRRLATEHPERTWEVVNTAAPGYNTAQEVELFLERCLALEPDLVVLGLVVNDVQLPQFVRLKHDPLDVTRSFALDLLRGTAAELPPEYRDLAGWEAFEESLDRLRDAGRVHGFDVVAVTFFDYEPVRRMRAEAAERGFGVLSLYPRLIEHLAERGIPRYRGSELAVSAIDTHPSAIGHRIAADALYEHLVEEGHVAELTGGTGATGSRERAGG